MQQSEEVSNDMAIVIIPNQPDVIQVISPNRVLHDIVTYNLGGEELVASEKSQAKGVECLNEEMNYLPI